jgi:cysteinyl-tRNA synthetase, unknown class
MYHFAIDALEARTHLAAPAWSEVNDFAYQLQDVHLPSLRRSKYDLLVIDYARDGTDATRFTREQVRSLQVHATQPKRVLAYLSVGEAEDYRFYWDARWSNPKERPPWLGPANPDWPGNYKVRYWDGRWQKIAFRYLDKIIEDGFDGAYLDVIDAYEFWGPAGNRTRPTAAGDMVAFVRRLAYHARVRRGRPDFAIFLQNGEALIKYPTIYDVVTGIGREDTFYTGNRPNLPAEVERTLRFLDRFRDAGKPVLTIDYVTTPGRVDAFYAASTLRGFIPHAPPRELDRLTIHPDHPPD